MPIQWGPSVKLLSECGLEVCDFCNVAAPFVIVERSTQFRLMFVVPLAQVSATTVKVCLRCKHEVVIPQEKRSKALTHAATLPSHDVIERIWNHADGEIASIPATSDYHERLAERVMRIRDNLNAKYKPSDVAYVMRVWFENAQRSRDD